MNSIRRRSILGALGALAGLIVCCAAPPAAIAERNVEPQVTAISCPAAGQCTVVGSDQPTTDDPKAVIFTERNSAWSKVLALQLPAGADATPYSNLTAVSCMAAGDCAAVGSYQNSSGATEGLLAGSTKYWWDTAEQAPLPAGGKTPEMVDVNAVSCASVGNCVAVGDYRNGSGVQQAMIWTQTDGAWARGTRPALPSGVASDRGSSLTTVDCEPGGNCSAAGWFAHTEAAAAGVGIQGLVLSRSAGKWSAGTAVELPADAANDPEVTLDSLACAVNRYCTAVGSYTNGHGELEPLAVTESAGVWSAGTSPPLPAGAATTGQYASLDTVSCDAGDLCTAGGSYYDSSGSYDALLVTGDGGALTNTAEAELPSDAIVKQSAQVTSVGCDSSGACLAVGSYLSTKQFEHGLDLEFSGGLWDPGSAPAMPAGTDTNDAQTLGPSACTSTGACSVISHYTDTTAAQHLSVFSTSLDGDSPLGDATVIPLTSLTAAQAKASVTPVLEPTAALRTRAAMRSNGGATLTFTGSVPSKVAVTWTASATKQVKRKRKVGKKTKTVTVTKSAHGRVASSSSNFEGAGQHTIQIKLNALGKSMLSKFAQVKVSASVKLTAEGLDPVTRTKTFLVS